MEPSVEQIPNLLSRSQSGDQEAASKLVPLLYNEMHRLAEGYMRRERPDHTLQATALVHEAYLKLARPKAVNWQNKAHFLGIAAHVMRCILIDHARGHLREKRGGKQQIVSLDEALVFPCQIQ